MVQGIRIFSDPLALKQGCHELRRLSDRVPIAARPEYLQQLQVAESHPDRFLEDPSLQEQFIRGVGHRSVLLQTPLLFSNPEHDGGLMMGYSRPFEITIGDRTTIVQEQERNFRVYDAEQVRRRVTLGVPIIDWKVVLNNPRVLSMGNHARGYVDRKSGTVVIANGDTNAFASLLLQQRFPELARRALVTELDVSGPVDLLRRTPASLRWYVVKPRPAGTWIPFTKVLAFTDRRPTMDGQGRLNVRHREDGKRFVVDTERLPKLIKNLRGLIYSARRRSVTINPRSLLIDMEQGEVLLGERVDHVLLEGEMAVDIYGEVRGTLNPLHDLHFQPDSPFHAHLHLRAQAENLLGIACAEILDEAVREQPERFAGLDLSYRDDPAEAIFMLIASFADIDPASKVMEKLQPRWDRQEITTVQMETARALLFDAMSAQADAALRSLMGIELLS
jgi:hypothetical protein